VAETEVATKSVRAQWRWVPLASGVLTLLAIWLTLGAAVVLVPISLALTVLAVRRTADAFRDFVVILGFAANGLLGLIFVATVAMIVYDALAG
jgi:hypothetical protein